MNPLQFRQGLHFYYFFRREKICRNIWNCLPLMKKQHSSTADSEEKEDFFGINEKDALNQLSGSGDAVRDKDYIYKKHLPNVVNKMSDPSLEKIILVPFGSVRLDSHNKPVLANEKAMKSQGRDIQEEGSMSNYNIYTEAENNISNFNRLDASKNENISEFGYIDDQYFPQSEVRSESKFIRGNKKLASSSRNHILKDSEDNDLHAHENQEFNNVTHKFTSDDNFIDSQYFNEPMSRTTYRQSLPELDSTHRTRSLTNSKEELRAENLNFMDNQYFGQNDETEEKLSFQKKAKPILTQEEPFEIKDRPIASIHEEQPENAFDVAMKIRKKLRNANAPDPDGPMLDSKGFRILKDQVVDLSKLTNYEIVNHVRSKIIYDKNDIVAINKPYGLSSHGGPGLHVSLAELLPELAAKIHHKGTLHLIHRLDKETTGVLLLARTAEMAAVLHKMFREYVVIKKYWAITKGVPNPNEGLIDIPVAEGTVDGKSRMVLKPDYTEKTRNIMKKSSVKRTEAVTEYKVLCSSFESALVECQPKTGVKHQIRVHLAFGLNTPIIGDHKYSHINKLAPQRLFPAILERLHVRQSKARYIPMHLHSKSIILPQLLDGKNLFITANLPYHFRKNMKSLKLRVYK